MAKKHFHRYHKVITSMGDIWACGLPDCQHFMPMHMTPLLVGKSSICWSCGNPMILTQENMKSPQPTCSDCKGEEDLVAAFIASKDSSS